MKEVWFEYFQTAGYQRINGKYEELQPCIDKVLDETYHKGQQLVSNGNPCAID